MSRLQINAGDYIRPSDQTEDGPGKDRRKFNFRVHSGSYVRQTVESTTKPRSGGRSEDTNCSDGPNRAAVHIGRRHGSPSDSVSSDCYRSVLWIVLAISLALLAPGSAARAARLVYFEIYKDDSLIMQGIGTDSGREDPSEVWNYLHDTTWEPIDGFTPPVNADEPLQTILEGVIRIRASHAETILAEAVVGDLVLVRDAPEASDWRFSPAEVTRTGVAAGVVGSTNTQLTGVSPSVLSGDLTLFALLCIGGFVILFVVLTLVVALSTVRRNRPKDSG